MPITAKLFDEAQKLRKRIFKGRPNIFLAEDLSQQIDIIDNNLKRLSDNVGLIRYNWKVNMMLDKTTVSGTSNVYDSQIHLIKVVDALPAYVFFNGIRFEIPTGNLTTYTGTFTKAMPEYPIAYVVLVATKKVINFSTNPVIAGVTADEYPSALPSSDVLQYSNERLVYTDVKSSIVLGVDEEIIGIIASVIPEDDGAINVTSTVTEGITTITTSYAGNVKRKVLYHAILPEELTMFAPYSTGDNVLKELKYVQQAVTTQLIDNNGSLNEAIILMNETANRKQRYTEMGFRGMQGKLDIFDQTVQNLTTLLASINTSVTQFKKFKEIPIGGIIPYDGPLTDFDDTGLGKGTMLGFAIMNGANSTADWRGRVPIMAVNGVGTATLDPEVNPANPDFPGGLIPNHTAGEKGGVAAKKLSIAEMPAHVHKQKGGFSDGGYDGGGNDFFRGRTTTAATDTGFLESVGGSQAFSMLPPYAVTVYIKRIS